MDWVVQKATELGVVRIVPVQTARSVVRLNPERGRQRHRHWLGVATSACEQCGRSSLPEVNDAATPCADALSDEDDRGLAADAGYRDVGRALGADARGRQSDAADRTGGRVGRRRETRWQSSTALWR